MNNEQDDIDEMNLTVVQRVSSVDSLEPTDGENLRFITGYHKWINTNSSVRVENDRPVEIVSISDDDQSILLKTLSTTNTEKVFIRNPITNEEEEDFSYTQMDISANQYDFDHRSIHYEIFSSDFEKKSSKSYEMEVDSGENHSDETNQQSPSKKMKKKKNSESDESNYQQQNGENPNRNNNNSRRSNDEDDSHDDDDDDDMDDMDDDDDIDEDDDNDDETDESLARRLGFLPIDNETVEIIGRLRALTKRKSFDRRDFEIFQNLIDQLIHIQHLEHSSKDHLKDIIHLLKLYRPLHTKSRALVFLQERIPRRAVKYNVISTNSHSNVFNIWRERERRARVDSRDSLEDDEKAFSGQQLRDVVEINNPTPPIVLTSTISSSQSHTPRTKVKQMAKDIDTRSVSSRSEINLRTGDRFSDHAYMPRSSSPTYPGHVSVAVYDVKSNTNQLNSSLISPTASSESSHVRKLIDRLESSSTISTSDTKKEKKSTPKKSIHDEQYDLSSSLTSSPPNKRVARRDSNEQIASNERQKSPVQERTRDSIEKSPSKEVPNGIHRTASGTTIEEYVTTLLPETETSLSIVRDVRARVYDDQTTGTRTQVETVPIKVDVETLYIVEEKSDRKSLSPVVNIYIPDYEYNRSTERQDFSTQTTAPTVTIKPPHRPIGTQVDSLIEQHTVGAQTTDSLHRPSRERQRLPTPPASTEHDDEEEKITTTTTTITTRYEIKRRHSSHHISEDEDESGAVVYIDDKSKKSEYEDNFEFKRDKRQSSTDDQLPQVPNKTLGFGQIASRIRIDQLRDINRHIVHRHVQENQLNNNATTATTDEYHSSEVYEIHTRGACKCLVLSSEEKTQYGNETHFEKQLQRIERTYTKDELKSTELHVIVTSSDVHYQLVKRDYGLIKTNDEDKENQHEQIPTISIHYYSKDGKKLKTDQARRLEHLPLVIRSEIEYELNHYGSAQIIILAITNAERRQLNVSLKKELVDDIVSRSAGRLSPNSPELEQEITRQLAEPSTLLHLVDYSSRDDYTQTNSTDLRRVSRIDVTTSLRLVQRYRTTIHHLCQMHRSHLRLTHQAEQQRYLILVSHDEYYLLNLASQIPTNITDIRKRQHDIFKREVNNVITQPFDFVKYRQDMEQQQRVLQQEQIEQQKQTYTRPPPPGHPSEAEFYLGTKRRALIEREIHSIRESIRPHEHATPRYKREPPRRSLSICYTGSQRYVRARIIHIKDFYDDHHSQQRQTKEQELFVRVDDFINESVANSLRRSYSTDYLQEDGPRSRIRFIRIPGETIKIEEKTTYAYKGVMYADLPYSLRYWNILSILDREARQGRPLGSTLPQVIVNDPYRAVIPPLTQQEIRQTAQQILSPNYNARSYTDQTLRWFLSRDNRTEVESAKFLQTLDQYRDQQQKQITVVPDEQQDGTENKYYVTEKLVRYEKMPDRLVPIANNQRTQSKDSLTNRPPSIPPILHPPSLPVNYPQRSQSQPRPRFPPSQQRQQFSSMQSPLSRHQSVHELHTTSPYSHPPSPSPSLHSLHQHHHQRLPVSFHNRMSTQQRKQPVNPLFTEIIDSQTGQRILTTSQEQLPTEVLGLLNKYNLQQF